MRALRPVLVIALLGVAAASAKPDAFPVPRAESEFRALHGVAGDLGLGGRKSRDDFVALAGPYAPLDLEVRKAADSTEASTLRGLRLAAAGREAGIDPEFLAGLHDLFHCGDPCTVPRRLHATERLDAIRAAVSAARKARRVHLVAYWGQPGSFRVNDMFDLGDTVREAVASRTMGFVPSGRWKSFPDVHAFFKARGIEDAPALEAVRGLEAARVSAIVLLSDRVARVVISGVGDNRSGLIFQPASDPIPALGTRLEDGTQLDYVREIEAGVIYYETT